VRAARSSSENGKTDALGFRAQLGSVGGVDGALAPRRWYEADRASHAARLDLVAESAQGRGRRPDERRSGFCNGFCEVGILAEQAVARVHRIRSRRFERENERFDAEVALAGGRRSNQNGLVGERDVLGRPIGLRVHGDRAKPQALGRAQHTAGDFPAIRDEQLFER
jgi:hypothetical protein